MSDSKYHYHYTTVQEHRAPTDDSIKILREMEDKVLDQVVSRLNLRDNIFGDVLVVKNPLAEEIVIAFKLNGKTYKAKLDVRDVSMISMVNDDITRAFYKRFTQSVADALFEGHYQEILF